jgi:hypothetical protein
VLRTFVFIRTRASGNALARARANIPVLVIAAICSVCDALAVARSKVPIVILRAGLGSAFAAASLGIPIEVFSALLGQAVTDAAIRSGL